jgi:hypothetical protein
VTGLASGALAYAAIWFACGRSTGSAVAENSSVDVDIAFCLSSPVAIIVLCKGFVLTVNPL